MNIHSINLNSLHLSTVLRPTNSMLPQKSKQTKLVLAKQMIMQVIHKLKCDMCQSVLLWKQVYCMTSAKSIFRLFLFSLFCFDSCTLVLEFFYAVKRYAGLKQNIERIKCLSSSCLNQHFNKAFNSLSVSPAFLSIWN